MELQQAREVDSKGLASMQMAIDSAMHTGLRILTGNRGPGPAETSQSAASIEKLQSPSRSGSLRLWLWSIQRGMRSCS